MRVYSDEWGDKISHQCHTCDNLPAHHTASPTMEKGTISSKKYRNYGHGGLNMARRWDANKLKKKWPKSKPNGYNANQVSTASGASLIHYLKCVNRTPQGQCK